MSHNKFRLPMYLISKSSIIVIIFVMLFSLIGIMHPNTQVFAASADEGFIPDANSAVHVIKIADDGKIWIGGEFSLVGGIGRVRLARLNPDGSLDTSITTGTDGTVRAIAIQPDGGVLVGGAFTQVTNPTATRNHLFRIKPDGTIDNEFTPNLNAAVYTIGLQSNGDIIVGGDFTTVNGEAQAHIARLKPDGSLDPTFSPTIVNNNLSGGNPFISRLAVQSDDRIVIAGLFDEVNSETRVRMTRLDKDGQLDPTFLSTVTVNFFINDLIIQPDGKILFSGQFDFVNGSYRPQIARLNTNGSLDNEFMTAPWPQARIDAVALQSDGKILLGGSFTNLTIPSTLDDIPRNRIARLFPNGQLDMDYDPDIGGGDVLALAVQSNGGHLVGGRFTTVNNELQKYLARLYPSGLLDKSIDKLVIGPDGSFVFTVASQPDGSALIGGFFSTVDGVPRSGLARLKPNLSLDTDFTPDISGESLSIIFAIAVQPDGKVLIGGIFDEVNSTPRSNLARLNQDGTLDLSFNPNPDDAVRALLLQPDGKIWVGGDFESISGSASGRIARLDQYGSGDMLFSPGANAEVLTFAQQFDGSLVVGGYFTELSGETRRGIGRLLPNGTLDGSFNPGTDLINSTQVQSLVVQPDGKILVGGNFEELAGVPRDQIARLESNGAIDNAFNPGADRTVNALALQVDGSIIVGGIFDELDGIPRKSLAKLDQDGNLIPAFDADVDGSVYALALQFDGKLLVGGLFDEILDMTDVAFARIAVDEVALQSLSISNGNTTLEWSLAGSMPVLSAVNFSLSTDGSSFSDLGLGTRTTNGWELTGLNLETGKHFWIRAKGIYGTGNGGSSVSVIESTWNVYLFQAPTITSGAGTFAYVGSEMNLFTFAATGIPTPQITLSGNLPSGLEFMPFLNGTANLSGTPDEGTSGVYSLLVTASNGVQPDASQNFTLNIYQRPEITSADNATAIVEMVFEFIITTIPGYPLADIELTGQLPAGIEFIDNGDGSATISGTAEEGTEGEYDLVIKASSFCCSGVEIDFTLTVVPEGDPGGDPGGGSPNKIYLPLILR